MAEVTIKLSYEQLLQALRCLPEEEKLALWRALDPYIDREAVRARFAEAVATLRATYASVPDDEVLADVATALEEVRAAHRPTSRA